MEQETEVLIVGLIGLDKLLMIAVPIVPGGKQWVQVVETPGYFGFNFATHLTAEGIACTLLTVVGCDPVGETLVNFLSGSGIRIFAPDIAGHLTPSSHILIEEGERTVLRTQGSVAEAWAEEHIPWHLLREGNFTWCALGHLPADQDGSITRRLIQKAHQANIPVGWTPGGTQIHCSVDCFTAELRLLRLLVLNREEAILFCQLPKDTSVYDATFELAARVGKQTIVVVTDGGNSPAMCYNKDRRRLYTVPPLHIQVVDPTGAGDAFHAGLTAGLIKGMQLGAALELARRRAAAACTVWGGGLGTNNAELELLQPPSPISAFKSILAHDTPAIDNLARAA